MRIKSKQYAKGLFELICNSDKKEADKLIKNFVNILALDNKISKVEEILKHFSYLWNKEKGIIEADVISADKLSKDSLNQIKIHIIKETNASEIVIREIQDKKIIGGVVIKFDDRILDGSVKNRIMTLKNDLKNA